MAELKESDVRWQLILPYLPGQSGQPARRNTDLLGFMNGVIARLYKPKPKGRWVPRIRQTFYRWCKDGGTKGGATWGYVIAVLDEAEEVGDFTYSVDLPDLWDGTIDLAYAIYQNQRRTIKPEDVQRALRVIFADLDT